VPGLHTRPAVFSGTMLRVRYDHDHREHIMDWTLMEPGSMRACSWWSRTPPPARS
jgi:hypothetical protein